jgi:hypothetical protein
LTVDTSVIGAETGAWRVTVDRAPIANFARVLGDTTPVLADTPAPPTFSFVMAHWGAYPEDQPPDPSGGTNPMHKIMGELHGKGALVLHGEQSITDIYEKDTDAATMTFVVMETRWTDARTGDPVVTERFNLIARLRKER